MNKDLEEKLRERKRQGIGLLDVLGDILITGWACRHLEDSLGDLLTEGDLRYYTLPLKENIRSTLLDSNNFSEITRTGRDDNGIEYNYWEDIPFEFSQGDTVFSYFTKRGEAGFSAPGVSVSYKVTNKDYRVTHGGKEVFHFYGHRLDDEEGIRAYLPGFWENDLYKMREAGKDKYESIMDDCRQKVLVNEREKQKEKSREIREKNKAEREKIRESFGL